MQDGRRTREEKGGQKGNAIQREQDGENLLGQGSDVPKLPARSVGPANAIQGGPIPHPQPFLPQLSVFLFPLPPGCVFSFYFILIHFTSTYFFTPSSSNGIFPARGFCTCSFHFRNPPSVFFSFFLLYFGHLGSKGEF